MKYGLIGEHLGHSFSKEIHEQLANYQYDLIPLTKVEFKSFMEQRAFDAINVTIPYKQDVIPYLDQIDDKAKRIGAVNSIVHKDGKLFGYNTDYDGFLYTLRKHKINVQGKKVLILGDGGAAQAIKAVLQDEQAQMLISIRRSKSDSTYTMEEAIRNHHDVDIIINTSPCGMYPHLDTIPCDLNNFPVCEAVVDIIYNPLHTKLLVQAEACNKNIAGGLEMLIAQAKEAVTRFTGKQIEDHIIDDIYRTLLDKKSNIVLIGMPSCGKTTLGHALANRLGKEFIDVDEELIHHTKRTIKDIIEQDGEPAFRAIESDIVKEISARQNCIIATGGGVIKNEENMIYLKMNGIILHIHRDIESLLVDDARPLSSSKEAIQKLYEERLPLYHKHSITTIDNNTDIETASMQAITAYKDALQHI